MMAELRNCPPRRTELKWRNWALPCALLLLVPFQLYSPALVPVPGLSTERYASLPLARKVGTALVCSLARLPRLAGAEGPRPPASPPPAAADRMQRKLDYLERNGRKPRPDPHPTELTREEVNAYFAAGRVKLPPSVKRLQFSSRPGIITANSRVDFDELTAGKRSSNPLLYLFRGTHDVEVVAGAEGDAGVGHIHVRSAALDGVSIPHMALQFFVDKYLRPKYPNVGIDTDFQMLARIDTAVVGQNRITLIQK